MSNNREAGFPCRECGTKTFITDSRSTVNGIRRRRMCGNRHKITTYETTHKIGPELRRVLLKMSKDIMGMFDDGI